MRMERRSREQGESKDAACNDVNMTAFLHAWSAETEQWGVQVRLIGMVGGAPEVRQIGDQLVAQVSLGVRPKSGNNLELTWLVVDCWNAEV